MVELQPFYLSRIEEALAELQLAPILQWVEHGKRGLLWLAPVVDDEPSTTEPIGVLGFEFAPDAVRFTFSLAAPVAGAGAHAWAFQYREGIEGMFPLLARAIFGNRLEDKRAA